MGRPLDGHWYFWSAPTQEPMKRNLPCTFTWSLALALLLGAYGTASAQYAKPTLPAPVGERAHATGSAERSVVMTTPLAGEVGPDAPSTRWSAKVTRLSARDHMLPEVAAIKAAKQAQRSLPTRSEFQPTAMPKAVTPVIGNNFEGNWSLQQTPPDNSMAISNAGLIVSANNDEVLYMNTNGQLLQFLSLSDFVNDPQLNANIYDPKVIYDSQADRFVLTVLHGSTGANSVVILCFSKSNNPQDGWWKYYLPGNVLQNNNWFDYPSLGVSNNEVYITGNLFTSGNNQFTQAIVFQVQKAQGYNGGSLNWVFWHNLTSNPFQAFTLSPASWGQQGNYGPGILFVSTSPGQGNAIRLWDLTDDLTGNPSLNDFTISVPAYSAPANASQLGNNDLLVNGDCRIMNAFFLNNTLHYTHCLDAGGTWGGFRYGRVNVQNLGHQQVVIGAVGNSDLAYPAVASFASGTNDPSVMIAFTRSSPSIFPEVQVINVDQNLQLSTPTLVKAGETFVNFQQGPTERWGDYTGISRKHNASSPTVWLAACFGANIQQAGANNTWVTWIAEVGGAGGVGTPEPASTPTARLFPNPVVDLFTLEFDLAGDAEEIIIDLTDMSGAVVKQLHRDVRSAGAYRLTFNRNALAAGTYILTIRKGGQPLSHETLVVH